MKTIILDTSFLVACAEFKIDYAQEINRIIQEEFTITIIDKTINELDALIAKGGKQAQHAKLAKAILARKNIASIQTSAGSHVDKLILENAKQESHMVATIDTELKKKLQQKKIGLIMVRQKKYLAMQ
ncbi:MAG: hypothetical protein HY363_01945 [Candidatus Aenigmarchaeota archaeon]|nr:hypothetical protein [Candidatus Aenigmarchaeota archaeon]